MPTTEIIVNNADAAVQILDAAADPNSGGHVAVRDGATATNEDGVNAQTAGAVYTRVTKSGTTTYQCKRYFGFFDTSGITTEVTSATLSVHRANGGGFNVIVVKSSAFGGDGSAAIDVNSFNDLDFSTPYSSATNIAASSGYHDITLNSTALTDIENNDILIIALCQHANDFSDSDPGSGVTMEESLTINTGNHSSQPKLSVTTADPIPKTLKLKSGLIQLKNGIIRI